MGNGDPVKCFVIPAGSPIIIELTDHVMNGGQRTTVKPYDVQLGGTCQELDDETGWMLGGRVVSMWRVILLGTVESEPVCRIVLR